MIEHSVLKELKQQGLRAAVILLTVLISTVAVAYTVINVVKSVIY